MSIGTAWQTLPRRGVLSATVAGMAQLVLTAIGDDREGLVSALSRVVDDHRGNWLDSQFSRLAGKFAGIVLVELEESRAGALEAAVADLLDELGWRIDVTRADAEDLIGAPTPEAAEAAEPAHIHLVGQDRPGMVRQITAALADQHVSIDAFNSWTTHAPEGGGVLFEADAVVRLPPGADESAVRGALDPIANELMVDLDLMSPP